MNRKKIGIFAAGAALVALLVAARHQSASGAAHAQPQPKDAAALRALEPRREAAPPARPLRCEFSPGDRLGYTLRSTSVFGVAGQVDLQADPSRGGAQADPGGGRAPLDSQRRVTAGGLDLRALPPGGARPWTLAAVVEGASVDARPDLASALSTPVLVRLDERCQVREVGVPRSMTPAGRNQWAALLKQIEFSLPGDGSARSWTAQQSDTMGDFVASYTRSDGPDGGASAQRTRQGYLHLHGNENGMAAASVPRSVVTARWLAQGRHVHELSAEERVILRVAGNTVADVKTSVSLASRDVSGALGGFWTSEFRAEDFVFSPADRLAKEPPDPRFANRAPIPGLAQKTTGDVLAEVAAFLAQKPKINHDGALNLLVQYLRLKPEAARAFHDEMRAGKVPDEVRSFVFLGMELAGGAAARAELIAAADDHKLAGVDRLRAISALSQVPDPDSSVIDALTRAAGERSPEGAERRAGAVLALGVAARDESALSADDKKRVAHYLGAELSRAGSPGDAVAALGGMGNMGDPSFREAAAALVDDPRPGVAVEAYRTLQKLGALPPQGALLDAFARASQQPLKSELSGILSSQKLAPEEVARCAALLAANPPPATRALLITLLGSIARDNADAKAALIRHFPLEKEGQLLALLGRFLTLKDLP